jgi:predicted YcjX-like family ATPase
MSAFFSDQEKLREVDREIAMRRAVYGKGGQAIVGDKANQLAIMEAIRDDYATKVVGIAPDDKSEFAEFKETLARTASTIVDGYTPVQSANLAFLKHVPETDELFARFHAGSEYRYAGVSRATVDRVITASSPGSMFNALIVKGGFSYEKLKNWK